MNNIIKKASELTNIVMGLPSYQEYLELENLISKHNEINELTSKVKELQKEAVKLEHGLKKDVTSINNDVKNTIVKLDSIPLFHHFNEVVEDLDTIFLEISNELNLYIEELINF